MILLDGNTYLEIVTDATTPLDVDVTWVDIDSTTYTPDHRSTNVAETGSQVICETSSGSPAPVRKIKQISIVNTDSTNDVDVYINKEGSPGTFKVSPTFTLLAKEMVHYIDGRGWVYYAASGIIKTA